jgi:hypothetical protein
MHAKPLAAACAALLSTTLVSSALADPAAVRSFNPDLALTLQGLYRKADARAGEVITGFLPAVHAHGDEGAEPTRGFLLGESELTLSANVDQHFKALVNLAFGDTHGAEVEEAWFQTLALGHGLTLKGGRFLSGIGYANEQHPHAWDFADPTLMQRALFGDHGYGNDGVQLKWLAPTDTFVEFGLEAGRGANFPGTDRNANGNGAGAAFVHVGGDLGEQHSWRAGLSVLSTRAAERDADLADAGGVGVEAPFTGTSRVTIVDLVWKWAIAPGRSFKLQAEAFRRKESGHVACADLDPLLPSACSGGITDTYASRQSGGYLQAVYQFAKPWRVGLRLDRLDSGTVSYGPAFVGVLANADFTPRRTTVMADWSPSEFSRLRLQFARDESQQGLRDRQLTLQYILSLGAHGAHKY